MGGNVSEDIFIALAGGRPEALAQRALKHALETVPAVRGVFIDSRLKLDVDREAEVEVEEERGLGKPVWRADLVIKWASAEPTNLELKIAHLTSCNQADAMERGDLHAFVRPKDHEQAAPYPVPTITWQDVADACDCHTLLQLIFEAAEQAGSYTVDRIDAVALASELGNYADSESQSGWPRLYGFLCRLDAELRARLGSDGYGSGAGWSQRRVDGQGAYYGFNFTRRVKGTSYEWWVGFHYNKGRKAVLGLAGGETTKTWAGSLVVADLVDVIIKLTGG